MSEELRLEGWVKLQDAPPIPNLRFRHFKGESDFPHMVAVTEGMKKEADQLELTISVEDIAQEFRHLEHCDPYRDFLLAEIDGKVVGYTRVWWSKDISGIYLSNHFVDLLPEWRGKGVRKDRETL